MPDENKKVYIKLHICYLLLDPAVVNARRRSFEENSKKAMLLYCVGGNRQGLHCFLAI